MLARHLDVRIQAKGTATSHHAFNNSRDIAPLVVIGASRRGEFAKEGADGHGVFTAALLRVMRGKPAEDADRRLRVDRLGVDVADEVPRIQRQMGLRSGQRVKNYLGSADFPLLMR